ncbi:Zn-dependent hydrolase [soil metagenome]
MIDLAQMPVDVERLTSELEELSNFSETTPPAITRVLFTAPDMAMRKWLRGKCAAAGLTIREDACGNIFARWAGSEPDLAAVATGSHCDAIPNSGKFDGTVGVLGGLEAIRALQGAGFNPRRSIELIMFTAEEPTRFGLGCVGSRLMAGAIDPARADAMLGNDGVSLKDARTQAGFAGDLKSVELKPGAYNAFVELHIEQGPMLEKDGLDIGIVTAIAAPASLRVSFEGEGGHAGAVLMAERHDALLGAAELAIAVEQCALNSGSPDTVGTVGVFRPFPGAINSIPSRCEIEIDIRDVDEEPRNITVEGVLLSGQEIAARRGLTMKHEMINSDPPARCDEAILAAAENACRALEVEWRPMVSRAYHDSLFMARIAPTAMIFIPCAKGVSHRPDEYSSPDAITQGAAVLAFTLAQLSMAD